MTKVLYPGSFDPVHLGHIDLVSIASKRFDQVVVAAVANPAKDSLFTLEERADMLTGLFGELPNVEVTTFGGLVVDLCEDVGADLIIRGLRSSSDYDSELPMALINRRLSGIDTVLLPATSTNAAISSRYIREIARLGGDVSSLVPALVLDKLRAKIDNRD